MSLERKLAVGSIRRSVGDYSVYFATFAFCACLLYTFASCRDYLLVLDTGQFSLDVFARVMEYIIPVGVFSIVVFCFLARYANRFLVRRRKAELATLQLVGMGKGPWRACCSWSAERSPSLPWRVASLSVSCSLPSSRCLPHGPSGSRGGRSWWCRRSA